QVREGSEPGAASIVLGDVGEVHLVDGVDGENADRSTKPTPGANPRPRPAAERDGDRAVGKTVQCMAPEEHLVTLGPDLREVTRVSWAGHHRGGSDSVRGRRLSASASRSNPNSCGS